MAELSVYEAMRTLRAVRRLRPDACFNRGPHSRRCTLARLC
jgi:hypothetical protein